MILARSIPLSSPHPWGCFSRVCWMVAPKVVFPTPVGVFLTLPVSLTTSVCLPHTRGGVSRNSTLSRRSCWSSPHPWGCFPDPQRQRAGRAVFPTPVGVFPLSCHAGRSLIRLPHTRGGVSNHCCFVRSFRLSSPHPWGCFSKGIEALAPFKVFPTPVGVFPWRTPTRSAQVSLPHTRGGVSKIFARVRHFQRSSPHPWGCFHTFANFMKFVKVFPTPVGVFLEHFVDLTLEFYLPHTRGGVSIPLQIL